MLVVVLLIGSPLFDMGLSVAGIIAINLGLMLIDLTNLSRINHYHGYQTGDAMLTSAHRQLLGISKLPDTVFRVGDHRFAFILPGLGNPAFIALATNKVHRVLEEELEVDKQMITAELKVGIAVNRLGEVALHMGKSALSPKFKVAFAHAFPFLEVMGDVVLAWMLLWRAALAKQKLDSGVKKKDAEFYEGQLKSAEFFILTILPTTLGKMNSIIKSNGSAVEISEAAFGG